MRLKVLLPAELMIDEKVNKIIAEAHNGSFCLLPKHVDFVAALVPGLLSFNPVDGEEVFLAVDEGTLVKCGAEVTVSTRNAVRGERLEDLRHTVDTEFRQMSEHERSARGALGRLEAGVVRRFIEFRE